jgi:hypothetical protein
MGSRRRFFVGNVPTVMWLFFVFISLVPGNFAPGTALTLTVSLSVGEDIAASGPSSNRLPLYHKGM